MSRGGGPIGTYDDRLRTRAVGRVLLAAVRDEVPDRLSVDLAGAGDRLVAAAEFHGVPGYVHEALRRGGVADGDAGLQVKGSYQRASVIHLRTLAALRRIDGALTSAGIRWLVVKGPVLSERAHGRAGLRSYSDVDLIVDPEDFPEAVAALERAGGSTAVPDWRQWLQQHAGELPVTLPAGDVVDLHWHLVNSVHARDRFSVPMGDLLDRAVEVEVGGIRVRTLEPLDTLLHLALHTAMSGGHRLVWLKDVERTVATSGIDWDGFIDRADVWGVGLVAATVLDRARRVVLADVPPHVIRRLARGRSWLSLTRGLDRLAPPERAGPGAAVGRAVSKATGATGSASCVRLAGKFAAWARAGVGIPTADQRLDVAHAPGTSRERERFLDWVAGRATGSN